ncbi:hypothetical protein MPER_12506 [Moniliophthora perniciosa FA553]|nr:hypothetical protein MPER_12506 [Moniliophthora perniciosa FA553]
MDTIQCSAQKLNRERADHRSTCVTLERARTSATQTEELLCLVGTNTVPALQRIFMTAYNQKWSVPALIKRIKLAISGQYHCKNFTQSDIDLAMLVYELGGGSLLYALNHSPFALPSINTIRPYRREWDLSICVDRPRILQTISNINSMFGPHDGKDEVLPQQESSPERPGFVVLSWDEIAIEQRAEYLPETDEIVGGCMEHIGSVKSVAVGTDTSTIEAFAVAIRSGKVDLGHEATVGAVHCHRRRNYGTNPVYLAATCKKRGWRHCVKEIQTTMEAWKLSPFGESLNGPIMTIASDGDSTRRAALFMLLRQKQLSPDDLLLEYLGALCGLNLYTGKNGEIMDFD